MASTEAISEEIKMSTRASYTVNYNSSSHFSVITQMWGSTWPKVLPYCIFNVGLMALLIWLDEKFGKTFVIELSTQGHSFMTLVVSFLLVSRVTIGLGRYTEARDGLGVMYREQRELVQNMVIFSDHCLDRAAKEWRQEVGYRGMILLQVVMAVIDYPTTKIPAWNISELTGDEEEYVRKSTFALSAQARRWAHGLRSEWEETMRVPIHLAYLLRKSIHSQSKRLRTPMSAANESRLLGSVDSFMSGYYRIRKFLTTPVPFPLVQMSRTFVFLYIFTVPFVLLQDKSSNVAHYATVFVMTYGFMGLEIVAIELDDPFGDDENVRTLRRRACGVSGVVIVSLMVFLCCL
uniref:Bestrophin homolog n=1 Tax=Amphora coffeiformis TaxID=265554 RepID=A0A7S3PDH3_9STRA